MRLTILTSLFAVVLLVVACDSGGGGGMTLEEYFAALDGIEERSQPTLDAIWEQYGVEPGEEATPNPTLMAEYASAQLHFADELDELDPPGTIDNAHRRLVEASKDFAGSIRAGSVDYLDINIRLYEAICEVYAAADAAGIDHDFNDDFYCGPDAPYFRSTRTPTPTP